MQIARVALGFLLVAGAMTMSGAGVSRADDAPDRADVKTAQLQLHRLGLYDGHTRGSAGPETRKAVARYQQQLGLESTGALDRRTLFALKNPARVSACADAQQSMVDCLDTALALDRFLDHEPAGSAPGDGTAAEGTPGDAASAGSTTELGAAGGVCDDGKLPLERCLEAVSEMDGFLKSRNQRDR